MSSLEGVESATIQIEAEGTFQDPEFGTVVNAAGRGSGFIIDPSGIAVTNNHVVAGAALLRVWVGGEAEPRNARVLGRSECSDLAVIDIEGDDYPFLEWFGGDITTGLDIYVAGFPLGDPEYTLTRGIVAKEDADGESSQASVDSVIQHDASTNPGNSGGPVVNPDGQVVGVHYAGAPEVNQQFAIGRDEALEVIDQLRAGEDVSSIGVSAQAVAAEDGSFSGVWVASVEPGSPADNAGLEGGDIITELQETPLAEDGTLADYCDILRSHAMDDVLDVKVLRFGTGEVLEGQLNGRELEVVVPAVEDLPEDGDGGGGVGQPDQFVGIVDDTGALALSVPETWSDVVSAPWTVDGEAVGVQLAAAPSTTEFIETFSVPGVIFSASRSLATVYDVNTLLDEFAVLEEQCVYEGREEYGPDAANYSGFIDTYSDCGGEGTAIVIISAVPPDLSFIMSILVQLTSEADLEALVAIQDTFFVQDPSVLP